MAGSSVRWFRTTLSPRIATARDAAVLADVELQNERFAAWSRLAFVLLLSSALAFSIRNGMFDALALEILGVNAGLSLGGVLLAYRRRPRPWISWVLGFLDVAFVLGYLTFFSRYQATLPGQFKPAVVVSWGAFLALALSAIRGRPWLIIAQTALFAVGLALAIQTTPRVIAPDAELFRQVSAVFGPGQNMARITILVLAGAILAIATFRARINLMRAVAASRRAGVLSTFLAPAVASVVTDNELEALREGRHQDVGVLFADVRGFTSFSETLPPRDVAAFLTDFRRRAPAAIEGEGGIVDKFIGDEVMGLFGVPTPAHDAARRAERAGERLLAAMDSWNEERRAIGYPEVRVGVGVHYGPTFVGAIGDRRLEFTVLGDTVNVARRLEQMTQANGYDLLVTDAAHRAAGGATNEDEGSWVELPVQLIRGHREPVKVFALVDTRGAIRINRGGDPTAK